MFLDFDWNPVLFFIALVICSLPAIIFKKWTLVVLPVIVAYQGLLWGAPGWLEIFKWAFWILVILTLLCAVAKRNWAAILLIAFTVLAIMVSALANTGVLNFMPGTPRLTVESVPTTDGDNHDVEVCESIDQVDDVGDCVKTKTVAKDICPKMDGRQVRPPPGYVLNSAGNCVKEPEPPTAEEIARAMTEAMKGEGFRRDEWTAHVDWREHVVQRQSAFSNQTLKTKEDVDDFLAGSSRGSELARQQAEQALNGRPVTDCAYVPVQFNIPVQYRGNTYKQGGEIITPDGLRQARSGDVIWLCVLDGREVNWGASIRADCGNVKFQQIIPVRANTPPAPPVTCVRKCQPPSSPPEEGGGCVEIPDNGVYDCGSKNPATEPNQQDNIPDQVSGQNPGTNGPASPPSANPSNNYNPPDPPESEPEEDHNPPPAEPSTPPEDEPEGPPDSDPCSQNPDFCD